MEFQIGETDVDYEVWVDDDFCASANDFNEAMRYAFQYLEEGDVAVIKVNREVVNVLKAARSNIK